MRLQFALTNSALDGLAMEHASDEPPSRREHIRDSLSSGQCSHLKKIRAPDDTPTRAGRDDEGGSG